MAWCMGGAWVFFGAWFGDVLWGGGKMHVCTTWIGDGEEVVGVVSSIK